MADPSLLVLSTTISAWTVLSREALDEFSFSDVEEYLRQRDQVRSGLPPVERFAPLRERCLHVFQQADYLARFVAVISIWQLCQGVGPLNGVLYAGLGVLGLLFLLDGLLRPLGAVFAVQLTLWLTRPWTIWYSICWLPTWPVRGLHHLLRKTFGSSSGDGEPDQAEDEIMAAVSQGEYAGQIAEAERDMIESVLGLDDLTVDKLMTPRTDMHAINIDDGVTEAIRLARESGHSRLPVFESNRDNIVGICYAKDLLGINGSSCDHPDLKNFIREPLLVPASKLISDLLTEFRRSRVHIAVILDEYGGTAGLITMEDIVEEVFGDIDDEYDTIDEDEISSIDQDTHELDARLHVDEVNERFDANLPVSDRYESLGGLVMQQLGRIPVVGDFWDNGKRRLTVLEATDRRVVRVRLETIDEIPLGVSNED